MNIKRSPIKALALLCGVGFLSSCSSVYLPNVPATPMFNNKGEGYLAAHVNLKGNLSGNAGVAIIDNLAIIANGSYSDYKSSNHDFNQYLYEGGLGYYTLVGKSKRSVLEFYGGYGLGSTLDVDKRASTTGADPVESRDLDFNKIFVQANFSSTRKNKINLFGKKRSLNYGTAIRLSRIKMDSFKLNGVDHALEENVFVEPVFFTRMELSKGLQLQYTNGWNIGLMSNEFLKPGNAVFTLGLIYNFGRK
ncbi:MULTISPECIES: hypothetical protein [Sphingobacterium]|uniref:Outer membrane protein beta-barrel domain-containing protein n=1 Tax=Sphingobacterium tenebrionis TaxID=3111775 RepID=A0ABU8I7X8_9SPHI|nr:hypothetical protein [Sphingobacterium sp. CZ-2]QBR11830.1 hypothetical protein E3D81_06475 [Sphingobacterium sp. CZ-2]